MYHINVLRSILQPNKGVLYPNDKMIKLDDFQLNWGSKDKNEN